MQIALLNDVLIEPLPDKKAFCCLCGSPVISKCGDVNIWHWAHEKGESCDSWFEPETQWHRNWKQIFGKAYCERIITMDGVKHIADIFTSQSIVIELQNSAISKEIIRERELFYGERMIWIINGRDFKHNFHISSTNDFDCEQWDYYFIERENFIETTAGIVDTETGEIAVPTKEAVNDYNFSWSYARKSWDETIRHIFIDFGGDDLFYVIDGMGTSSGKGKKISKRAFILKYGGNEKIPLP